MPLPPSGIVMTRLISTAGPNSGNGTQPLWVKAVAPRSEPVVMHSTLLPVPGACAVTATQKLPHRLGNAMYQNFKSGHLFLTVGPFTAQHSGSLTGKSLLPPRAARFP